ncbi:MAG: SDR family NAD(P)-dependent oxidoreductase [Legionella sp.]|nr:SDR family NAD(P)-dependent oxidoreductase [Legionella sp.]
MKTKPNSERVVFITGASNGIGLAAAERFAKEGYIVIATARSPESRPNLFVTNFESSAQVGERFNGRENPYPQMHTDVSKWRALMQEGRPVSETINTIFRVACAENPVFWNPTESRVHDNFAETYIDPTGERFSKGPIFDLKPQELPIE